MTPMSDSPQNNANAEPISIDLHTSTPLAPALRQSLTTAVKHVLSRYGRASARLSIAIVDDDTIQKLNRQYLQHDWPTDVLSFPLEQRDDFVEGEIVASRETAERVARQRGCPPGDELLLYVVHGALHLVGFDDTTAAAKRAMRRAEREVLQVVTGPSGAVEGRPEEGARGPCRDNQGAHTG